MTPALAAGSMWIPPAVVQTQRATLLQHSSETGVKGPLKCTLCHLSEIKRVPQGDVAGILTAEYGLNWMKR